MTRKGVPGGQLGSRYAQRIVRRYAQEMTLLREGVPDREAMQAVFAALMQKDWTAGAALRVTRQLVVQRLVELDCAAGLGCEAITRSMTDLAEWALGVAFEASHTALTELHGHPVAANGTPGTLCVVGMGKLGARELNVSSDIDLVYVYDHDGETVGNATGAARLSNQEFFSRMVRAIFALIGDTTEHGFVFRVDLALRPNGNSGPPIVSLDALNTYFQEQGREWERFAWLKSRVVAPCGAARSACAQGLRNVVVPFVFRRYLDYSVFDALRALHRQIREHAARQSAGRPERSNDVKLSRGGIREIEFTVQLLQVVRGGHFPELRTRPTLSALQRLANANLMPQATADALARAYTFLRDVEHRIQYLDDQQTHVLPTADGDLAWIATTLGFADTRTFLAQLDHHRELVAQEFDTLLGADADVGGCKSCQGAFASGQELEAAWSTLDSTVQARLHTFLQLPRVQDLRAETQARLLRLLERTARWSSSGSVSDQAILRFVDWLEPLLRRDNYLALLMERPRVHERLLRLLGAARWPSRYLVRHPGVIDELASNLMLAQRFDRTEFERELELRRQTLHGNGEDDEEALLNLLRRAHHAEVFRTLARDVEGRLQVEAVADDLSALAESILGLATRWCWQRLRGRHREQPRVGIIAYGKLGGKELGYGSDLDLVFVYDDDDERAAEVYAALVRKLINWLTLKTGEGDLYEIDTALRPNGGSGLLVTSFASFANYQQQRGSNTAWTWEHQAMTRARWVLGDPALGACFDAVRENVIGTVRDLNALRAEVSAMREKVRHAHPIRGDLFDVKHSPGGMVDVEFTVQYLVLAHSGQHAQLRANVGNIALLREAQDCGLLATPLGSHASTAYRTLRQLQHRARLDETPTQVDASLVDTERAAVLALWTAVFGG